MPLARCGSRPQATFESESKFDARFIGAHALKMRDFGMVLNLGPVADEVVVDAGQLDCLRIVTPEPLGKRLDCRVEIEDHAAGMSIADHALQPEEGRNPLSPRHRRHHVQAGRWIEHEIAGRQFDLMRAVEILDHELPAVIVLRLGQEQRRRQIGADAQAREAIAAHGIVDMDTENGGDRPRCSG